MRPLLRRLLRSGALTQQRQEALFRHRLARLETPQPPRARGAADRALILAYAIVLLACMLETVAHTPSCFKVPI